MALSACALLAALVPVMGCGGVVVPGVTPARDSGQSQLMGQTLAGKNCSADNHDRPFVVEWDATDMSSFESLASTDVVLVRYDGCKLTVLDRCKDDSIAGHLGTYRPVSWTQGQLETVEIESEAELYAKLPLGAASLGGRVQGGEKFHMEYFVAGTRNATRDAVYTGDLAKLPGCKGATHFVYGYNLGAFALGSVSKLSGNIEGAVYGFGANASQSNLRKADKKGGDLTRCKGDSAQELMGCKVPLRLTLRAVASGENPDAAAVRAVETDAAANKAGKVESRLDRSDEAMAHYRSAAQKAAVRDGKGCLEELDAHDKLNPSQQSTSPKSNMAYQRAQCLMLAGKCAAGKQLHRMVLETTVPGQSAEQRDDSVEGILAAFCEGEELTPREQLRRAMKRIQDGTLAAKTPAYCKDAWERVEKFRKQVKPRDERDHAVSDGSVNAVRYYSSECFAVAGDCEGAYRVFTTVYKERSPNAKPPELLNVFNNQMKLKAAKCVREK